MGWRQSQSRDSVPVCHMSVSWNPEPELGCESRYFCAGIMYILRVRPNDCHCVIISTGSVSASNPLSLMWPLPHTTQSNYPQNINQFYSPIQYAFPNFQSPLEFNLKYLPCHRRPVLDLVLLTQAILWMSSVSGNRKLL